MSRISSLKYAALALAIAVAGCSNASEEGAAPTPKQKAEAPAETQDKAWLTDYKAATREAREKKLPILAYFSGSDWCPPCKLMHKEALSKAEFETFAKSNLILLMLDFPRKKDQPEDAKKQNAELGDKFQIEGFPTFVVLDDTGKELGRMVGYQAGGPDAFIRQIRTFTAKGQQATGK